MNRLSSLGGWWRAWIVACAVLAVVTAAGLVWYALVFSVASSLPIDGDLVRSLALAGGVAWGIACAGLLGIGYGVAWIRRGFRGRS
jgi:hypothetical protein